MWVRQAGASWGRARARVIEFDIGAGTWDASKMMDQRLIEDRLVGMAEPLL
jgi:hypothetical protein